MRGRQTWGFDLAGQVGQAGVRAELTRERPDGVPAYTRALLAAGYAFANTLTVTAELFFNGAGARDPSAYDFRTLMSGESTALGRRYAGVHAGYELTPLWKWDNDLVVNLADHSRYLASSLTCSVRTNLDLRLGVQRFSGASGTIPARRCGIRSVAALLLAAAILTWLKRRTAPAPRIGPGLVCRPLVSWTRPPCFNPTMTAERPRPAPQACATKNKRNYEHACTPGPRRPHPPR